MQVLTDTRENGRTPSLSASETDQDQSPKVIVCVDTEGEARATFPPAKAIAKALGSELIFVHVIEARPVENGAPFDPVEWDLRRREAHAHVSTIADEHSGDMEIATHVLEGRCAEQICSALSGRPQDITVLYRGHNDPVPHIGDTARRVLEDGTSSLLIVPATTKDRKQGFSRIVVPLDGSRHSESALLFAQKIAASEDAEIVLVHAIPEPVFTQAGPAEPKDEELREQVRRRNERVAQKYLNRICARVRAGGHRARAVVLTGGDVRRQLTGSVAGQTGNDLLVLASHGHSGFADVPVGDVASFVLNRTSVPALLIRCGKQTTATHAYSDIHSKGVRRPVASVQ